MTTMERCEREAKRWMAERRSAPAREETVTVTEREVAMLLFSVVRPLEQDLADRSRMPEHEGSRP